MDVRGSTGRDVPRHGSWGQRRRVPGSGEDRHPTQRVSYLSPHATLSPALEFQWPGTINHVDAGVWGRWEADAAFSASDGAQRGRHLL